MGCMEKIRQSVGEKLTTIRRQLVREGMVDRGYMQNKSELNKNNAMRDDSVIVKPSRKVAGIKG